MGDKVDTVGSAGPKNLPSVAEQLANLPPFLRGPLAQLIGKHLGKDIPSFENYQNDVEKASRCEVSDTAYLGIVFVRVPKNASSSISQYLQQWCTNQRQKQANNSGLGATIRSIPVLSVGHTELLSYSGENDAKLKSLLLKHYYPGAVDVKDTSLIQHLAPATISSLGTIAARRTFSFAVVRNPFDRIVSCWRFCCGDVSFVDFISQLETNPPTSSHWTWHQRVHTCSQADLLCDQFGQLQVTALLRFESLEDDFERVVAPVLSSGKNNELECQDNRTSKSQSKQVASIPNGGADTIVEFIDSEVNATAGDGAAETQPEQAPGESPVLPRLNVQKQIDFRTIFAEDPALVARVVALYRRDFELFGYPTKIASLES